MGQSTYPTPSAGASYSSQPPANASSVLLDGQLVSSGSYSSTITATGAPLYLYANGAGGATFTIGTDNYTVTAGSTVGTSAYSGSKSVTVAASITGTPSSWTTSTITGGSNSPKQAIYGASTWVLLTTSTTGLYSTNNGSSWSTMTLPGAYLWRGSFGNGYFVIVNPVNSTTAYSTNGITWTSGGNLPFSYSNTNTAYGTNGFVCFYYGSTSGAISTNNGTSWSSITLPSSLYWDGITYGNGYYVGFGGWPSSSYNASTGVYSNNGTTWTSMSLPSSSQWGECAYGNGTYVVISQVNTGTAAYSTNATTWTSTTLPFNGLSNYTANSIAYGAGYFVVTAQNATTPCKGCYSTNGSTWTLTNMNSSSALTYAIGYGNLTFIAVSTFNGSGAYASSYSFNQPLPVAFGIYNGPTTTH